MFTYFYAKETSEMGWQEVKICPQNSDILFGHKICQFELREDMSSQCANGESNKIISEKKTTVTA